MSRRVGILTGGGDVPGLNAAIKTFVWRMREEGYEVIGLRRGWAALLHIEPFRDADNEAWMLPLTRANTRTIDRSGGTMLPAGGGQVRPASDWAFHQIAKSFIIGDAPGEDERSRA